MGIDFSFDFYVHRSNAGRFLAAAVTQLCDRQQSTSTTVLLSDGTSVRLPGTYGFVDGQRVELARSASRSPRSHFDLSLCFPVDEPLRAYRDEDHDPDVIGRTWPDGSERVMVGYIYLDVSDRHPVLPDHWRFTFFPATSAQGKLFLVSPSIREAMATLALSTDTPLCLIDSDMGGPQIIVAALGRRISDRVPGPCLFWGPRGRSTEPEAFQELSLLLAGEAVRAGRWIIGPEHPEFPALIDSLVDYAQAPAHHWTRS